MRDCHHDFAGCGCPSLDLDHEAREFEQHDLDTLAPHKRRGYTAATTSQSEAPHGPLIGLVIGRTGASAANADAPSPPDSVAA